MDVTPLLYQFIVGGIIFAFGLVIPWRSGDYSWRKRRDRRLLLSMLLTCLFYVLMQSSWHLFAAVTG